MSKQKLYSLRVEKDLLGSAEVPAEAYYGIQTWRAQKNFNLSRVQLRHFPRLIIALAMVKEACAKANMDLGHLNDEKAKVIIKACEEIAGGEYHNQFVVDMIQGGAGTSTNMNANEVIANVALELLGHQKGDYKLIHPNNDVNLSQSTNDVYPTAVRLAILLTHDDLVSSLVSLQAAFSHKAKEFSDVIKMGRTQLQDAVPMTLGQEFQAWANTLGEDISRLKSLSELLTEVNLGGTAIGTGINAEVEFGPLSIQHLSAISDIELKQSDDLIEASSDMGAFVLFSSMLKRLAIKLSKIANDLRLLSMGPRAGINEINLPPQQPGSSIMPGKVNPVIPEAVNQVAYQVIGHDVAISMAAEAGQLQLNAMEPLIAYNILESMRLLKGTMRMFETRCIVGITANKSHCEEMVRNSIGVVTALNPYIGYENATRIAQRALKENRSVFDLVEEEGLLESSKLKELLSPAAMIRH